MTRRPPWQQEDPRFREESARYEKPIPSRELLLAKLGQANKPLGFEALAALLGIRDPGEREALSKRLGAMARDGELLVNRANDYCLVDRLSVVVGTASGHRDGFGFLVPDEDGDDLFLPYREMRMLFHGDRAAARVTGRDERGRPEGAIVEVLERRTRQVAGRFTLEGGVGFVTPDNRRISQRVVVPREATGTARHGDLAVVEITEQPSRNRDPVGRVVRVLPESGGADTAIDLAIASFGLSHDFPAEVLAEARGYGREVPGKAQPGREDLRDAAAGDDRRRGRARLRRRGVRGAGRQRLPARGRDCRRQPLRAARHGARPGGARARDLRVLPEPRAADAAGGAVQSPLFAHARCGPAVHGLRHAAFPGGVSHEEPLLPGRHALPGAVHLYARRRAPRRPRTAGARPAVARRAGDRLPAPGVQGAAPGAREAWGARLRGARVQGAGGRCGPADRHPRVPAQRRPSPDRGMHDRRQRAGGRLPEEEAPCRPCSGSTASPTRTASRT